MGEAPGAHPCKARGVQAGCRAGQARRLDVLGPALGRRELLFRRWQCRCVRQGPGSCLRHGSRRTQARPNRHQLLHACPHMLGSRKLPG